MELSAITEAITEADEAQRKRLNISTLLLFEATFSHNALAQRGRLVRRLLLLLLLFEVTFSHNALAQWGSVAVELCQIVTGCFA